MRYTEYENPIAAGVIPNGNPVSVRVLNLETGALFPLTSGAATPSPAMPGVYTFSLANIDAPIEGYTQVVIEFNDDVTGDKDYAKLVLRGYVDDVRRTRILVAATL